MKTTAHVYNHQHSSCSDQGQIVPRKPRSAMIQGQIAMFSKISRIWIWVKLVSSENLRLVERKIKTVMANNHFEGRLCNLPLLSRTVRLEFRLGKDPAIVTRGPKSRRRIGTSRRLTHPMNLWNTRVTLCVPYRIA